MGVGAKQDSVRHYHVSRFNELRLTQLNFCRGYAIGFYMAPL